MSTASRNRPPRATALSGAVKAPSFPHRASRKWVGYDRHPPKSPYCFVSERIRSTLFSSRAMCAPADQLDAGHGADRRDALHQLLQLKFPVVNRTSCNRSAQEPTLLRMIEKAKHKPSSFCYFQAFPSRPHARPHKNRWAENERVASSLKCAKPEGKPPPSAPGNPSHSKKLHRLRKRHALSVELLVLRKSRSSRPPASFAAMILRSRSGLGKMVGPTRDERPVQ